MSDALPLSLSARPARKWLHLGFMAFGPLIITAYIAAIALSGPLLDTGPGRVAAKADVMVVLGGDGPARADHALVLWRQQAASRIVVTGDGDCLSVRATLLAGGVSQADITTECLASSTWQNAEFSAPILASLGAHNALLVTNWFHARRALASFQALCPGMDFSVASVPAPSFATVATGPYGRAVVEEYAKTALYALRLWWHGLNDTPSQASERPQWPLC